MQTLIHNIIHIIIVPETLLIRGMGKFDCSSEFESQGWHGNMYLHNGQSWEYSDFPLGSSVSSIWFYQHPSYPNLLFNWSFRSSWVRGFHQEFVNKIKDFGSHLMPWKSLGSNQLKIITTRVYKTLKPL